MYVNRKEEEEEETEQQQQAYQFTKNISTLYLYTYIYIMNYSNHSAFYLNDTTNIRYKVLGICKEE